MLAPRIWLAGFLSGNGANPALLLPLHYFSCPAATGSARLGQVTAEFIPGLALSRLFYTEQVRPLLDASFPGLAHTAALIGSGSDVLGFDTPRSTDHDWGPRLQLFLADSGLAILVCTLAVCTACIRMLFSMARDGRLPFGSQIARVSGTRKVPIVPALFVGAMSLVLLAVNIAI